MHPTQEEVENKTVTLAINTTKMTARVLKSAISKYLAYRKNKSREGPVKPKTHIVNYSKTRDVYAAYKKSGWSRAFLAEHEPDIVIHRAAKKAFDDLGVGKLPTVKPLQAEFAALLTENQSSYAQLTQVRKALRELAVHKANYEELLNLAERDASKDHAPARS